MSGMDPKTVELISQIWPLVEPVVRSEGMELIEVEYRREPHGWVLRLFINKETGISVNDCAQVSQLVGDLLDVKDLIPNPYHLEVSSPGLNRPLRKWEHFQKVVGSIIDVRTVEALLQNRRNFKGILKESSPQRIVLECEGEQLFEIPLALVERARLCYFESEKRKSF